MIKEKERVSIEFNPHRNGHGSPAIGFTIAVDGQTAGPMFSVQGMVRRFPEHRQAIIRFCQEELLAARMRDEHLRVLERAISRAEA